MAISNKVITKKYIKDFVKNNLWHLSKDKLIEIAKTYNVEFKHSMYKDVIIANIQKTKGVDYWAIYQENKKYAFGIFPSALENLLDIDNKQRKKLDKSIVEIAYYSEQKTSWGKVQTPAYSLESLYKLNKDTLEVWKSKHITRKATAKQLEALEKARLKAKENLTCLSCNREFPKSHIKHRICINCVDKFIEYENINNERYIIRDILAHKSHYLVAHFETSNLSDGEVVSVAISDLNGNIIMDELLKCNTKISIGAESVHKITNEMVANDGMTREEFVYKIRDIVSGKKLIMWNINFLQPQIINFIGGGYMEPYCYYEWDAEYNESDYQKYKEKKRLRYKFFKALFGDIHDLYVTYAIEHSEYNYYLEKDVWTSVHRLPIREDLMSKTSSYTGKGVLSMLTYLGTNWDNKKLPDYWVKNRDKF